MGDLIEAEVVQSQSLLTYRLFCGSKEVEVGHEAKQQVDKGMVNMMVKQ